MDCHVLHTLARPLCFLAALVVIEGHLLIGQSVAWFTMIHERTPVLGLQQSIANTFSGAHPCNICTALQNESRKQKEDAPTPEAGPLVKVIAVLFNGRRIAVFPPTHPGRNLSCSESGSTLWQDDVPRPPPRTT
ncbi:MAG: hypothetical protein QF405_11455 [Roseibacillus sp.]|nr:hypothetical protein [Roseibacillus sp.]MDP7308245.1 hypothetical protein [Roseibacillus sp.]MDP7497131.1 hypothetical protein [Roseibacillus sp.]HJM62215.1 hypothetical protein [Roseibacillus sp.]